MAVAQPTQLPLPPVALAAAMAPTISPMHAVPALPQPATTLPLPAMANRPPLAPGLLASSLGSSLPQLNPNAAGTASDDARFNRATLGVYELGSTFKPFTVAMAMDSGIIKSFGQIYNCPDELHVYGHVIHDTHPFGRQCSVAEIMKESSNIGTAQIAGQLGAERQKKFLKSMGFLDKVNIELKERGRTLTPGNRWGPFETMTVGFGHAIAVTPLRPLGTLHWPKSGSTPATLLKVDRIIRGRGIACSPRPRAQMRALLRLVVRGDGRRPMHRISGGRQDRHREKVIGGHYIAGW
jgi:cell division protein FtsI (penicillin-binding protein 3)